MKRGDVHQNGSRPVILAFVSILSLGLLGNAAQANEPSGLKCIAYFAGKTQRPSIPDAILELHPDWSGVIICRQVYDGGILSLSSLFGPYVEGDLSYYRLFDGDIEDLPREFRHEYIEPGYDFVDKRDQFFVCDPALGCRNGNTNKGTQFAGVAPGDFAKYLGYRDALMRGQYDIDAAIAPQDLEAFGAYIMSARIVSVVRRTDAGGATEIAIGFGKRRYTEWFASFEERSVGRPYLRELAAF